MLNKIYITFAVFKGITFRCI